MRRPLAIALLLPVLCACGPQRARKPNHDYSQAAAIHPGRVRGAMSNPREADYYLLQVAQEGVLGVHVGGIRGMDFVLSVRDKDRRELMRVDETGIGGDEQVLDVGVHPGAYYIVLSNKNESADKPEQPYLMDVALEPAAGRERKPDDTLQRASPLELPGVTRGHYWPARNLLSEGTDVAEESWFSVDVATGLHLLNIDLSPVPKVDPILEVYDSNAYKLVEVDSGGVGDGESLRSFGVRGPVRDFLRLRSKYKNAGNPDVPFEILTELIPYNGKTEFEPNNQRQDATPFEGDAITGTIAPEGDVDWYKIAVQDDSKQILRAALGGLDGMELALKVCDSLGNPLLVVDDAGKGQPQVLTGIGVSKGDYYLVVSEKTGRKAESRQTYTLTKTLTPWQAGLEYEPNGSTATAQAVKISESVDGYIAPKGDVDFYQFNVYQKGTVMLELAGVLNVRFEMTLYDQDDKELSTWSAPKAGESLAVENVLDAGTYFVRLRAADPGEVNVRDKYSLRLKVR